MYHVMISTITNPYHILYRVSCNVAYNTWDPGKQNTVFRVLDSKQYPAPHPLTLSIQDLIVQHEIFRFYQHSELLTKFAILHLWSYQSHTK